MIENLRKQDRNEILASHGPLAFDALRKVCEDGDTSVGEIDGKVICMFGVAPMSLATGGGIPWLVSTDDLPRYAKSFMERNKAWIEEKLAVYGYLQNYVDKRNTVSKRWLRWLGFQLEEPKPYGVNKLPFHRFSMGER